MMRPQFDAQLETLNYELIDMGILCEDAIARSAKALSAGDVEQAKTVPDLAEQIDRKEREIEALCLKLILQQQPVATDLRVISAAMKLVTDMERIGNNSGDIAEIVASGGGAGPDGDIDAMARAVIAMVTDSIDAFVRRSVSDARSVEADDDAVDEYFVRIRERTVEQLRAGAVDGAQAVDRLMTAKYLERIGDHAVNIARWVAFSVSGNLADTP